MALQVLEAACLQGKVKLLSTFPAFFSCFFPLREQQALQPGSPNNAPARVVFCFSCLLHRLQCCSAAQQGSTLCGGSPSFLLHDSLPPCLHRRQQVARKPLSPSSSSPGNVATQPRTRVRVKINGRTKVPYREARVEPEGKPEPAGERSKRVSNVRPQKRSVGAGGGSTKPGSGTAGVVSRQARGSSQSFHVRNNPAEQT